MSSLLLLSGSTFCGAGLLLLLDDETEGLVAGLGTAQGTDMCRVRADLSGKDPVHRLHRKPTTLSTSLLISMFHRSGVISSFSGCFLGLRLGCLGAVGALRAVGWRAAGAEPL